MPINTGVIICEEYEEAIKAIFKSVDTKENVYGIKSVVVTLKGKKPEDFIEELVHSISFIKNINDDFNESPTNFIVMDSGTKFKRFLTQNSSHKLSWKKFKG